MTDLDNGTLLTTAWLAALALAVGGLAAHVYRFIRWARILAQVRREGLNGHIRASARARRRNEAYRVALKTLLFALCAVRLHQVWNRPPPPLVWEDWAALWAVLGLLVVLSVWTLHTARAERQG